MWSANERSGASIKKESETGERRTRQSMSLELQSRTHSPPISFPESSGSLVSGLVARRDSGEMEIF